MSGLKALRQRIDSIRSTRKITQAMRMVAASKCAKAQAAAHAARPYALYAGQSAAKLAAASGHETLSPLGQGLLGQSKGKAHLLVVATAQRGLCGGFNSQLVRRARQEAKAARDAGQEVLYLCLGKKGHDALKSEAGGAMIDCLALGRDPEFAVAQEAQDKILALLDEGKISSCTLVFAEFVSIISQTPTAYSLIPPARPEATDSALAQIYDYEPDAGALLESLLARNLGAQLWRAINENAAGEQGARMAAMDNATRNADDMIDRLSITYNRTRQAVITSELVEIISGAEAL